MKLRPGRPGDAEAITALIASFRSEITDSPNGAGAEQYLASVSLEAECGYLQSARYSYLVAERAAAMIGFIALRDVSHVFHLFVQRQHQRSGVARQLWEHVKAQVLQSAAPSQFTVNSSLQAVPVYRSFGFEPTGEVVSMHGISFLPMRLVVLKNEA